MRLQFRKSHVNPGELAAALRAVLREIESDLATLPLPAV